MLARRSQNVVAIDAPNDPVEMRAKLNNPDAAGMRLGARPDSASVIRGMKNTAIAMPWMIVGIISVSMSALVLKRERMNSTSARMENAAVANTRGSTLLMYRPTSGVSRMANSPTGASTQPAQVAV